MIVERIGMIVDKIRKDSPSTSRYISKAYGKYCGGTGIRPDIQIARLLAEVREKRGGPTQSIPTVR